VSGQNLEPDWIPAREAFHLAIRAVGPNLAREALCKRAHHGLIRARAAQLFVDDRLKENVDIPKGFWWAEGEAALTQNWKAGDFETWIDSKVHLRAFGVSFSRSDIEQLGGGAADPSSNILRAYENLDLHPEIVRAATELYRHKHYANAIEDAVKALNALVRLRSGRDDLDGTTLMETVFSPKKPILAFNEMADESDRNEQRGFMMMFAGAVAGLRNPRAHRLIKDDAERALEFIAFVSLLAKLLEGAKKAI
jgi:uncharacterized protein (TIGR02391 family)